MMRKTPFVQFANFKEKGNNMQTQILSSPTNQIREQAAQAEQQNAAQGGTGGLLQIGETVQGYVIKKLLSSKGGEAEIYLCTKNKQNYALKYFYTRSPDSVIMQKLFSFSGKHPDIVSYIDSGKYKERHFLILEYAEGGALDDKKPDGTYKYLPVSEDAALQIIKETINAFDTCHKNGIIHRDIKPGNLFYKNADGSDILVGDFGIASAFEAEQGMSKHLTKAGNSHTIGYAAPELFGGHKDADIVIGPEADYYALGITLWVLLTGKEPFVNEKGHPLYEGQIALDTIQGKTADQFLARSPELSKRMQTLIRGLLTVRHDKRWGHKEVSRFLTGENVEVFTEAARDLPPFEIAGTKYYDYKSAAEALLSHPEEGKSLIFKGKLTAWLIRIDQEFAEKILDITEKYSANDQLDKGVFLAAYALCPSLPFTVDHGERITSLQDMTALLESDPTALIPYLRDEKYGLYTYLEAIGLADTGSKVWNIVKAVPEIFKMAPRIIVALKGNVIKPFQDGINNDLELRDIEQLYNLPEYLRERALFFIERRCGELPAWIENLTGKNLEYWLWKLDFQNEKLIEWGKWKYFTLFLQGKDIQSGEIFEENEKCGYVDPMGNVLLPPVWEEIYEESISGKFIVKKNKKWGVVTPDGKTVIPFEYGYLEVFDEERGVYKAKTEVGDERDEYSYITETAILFQGENLCYRSVPGNPFEVIYNYYEETKLYSRDFRLIKEFDEEFKIVDNSKKAFVWCKENKKVCICNGSGETLKQTDYTDFECHCKINEMDFLRVEQNKRFGIADAEGNLILPPQYEDIRGGKTYFVRKDKKWGVIDLKTRKQIHSCEYEKVLVSSSEYYALIKDETYHLYKGNQDRLICKIVKKDNKYVISTADGKLLLTSCYIIGWKKDDEEFFNDHGYAHINYSGDLHCYDGQNFLSLDLDTLKIKEREIEGEDGKYLLGFCNGDEIWNKINNLKKQNKTKEMNLLVNATWKHFYDDEDWETARRILFFIKPDNMEGLDKSYDDYRAHIGCTLQEQQNYEDAVQLYEEAIKLNPDKKDMDKNWYNWHCGDCYSELENYKKALHHFEKSLELEPDDAWLWDRKGDALYNLERYKEAVPCYTMAIEHASDDEDRATFYRDRAETYAALGMEDKDDGTVTIFGKNTKDTEDAKVAVLGVDSDPEIGQVYNGVVKRIMDFGAFVEILPGKEGLVHISKLSRQRIVVTDVVKEGQHIPVKLTEIDKMGRLNLSYIDAIAPNGASGDEREADADYREANKYE
jgi:serine/threonine protein kinase/predicted RNA-binding protein with RPS1 domain